ncbi:hypothetical protein Tco_0917639 [Tanacetum coccineum]
MTIWLEDGLKNQDQSVETASGKLVTSSDSHSDDIWKFMTSSGSIVIKEALETLANFIYASDFMIVEDISSVIDPRMSPAVLGKPFVELSNMTYDLSLGVVKFTKGVEEIAYKMPHKIEQYDLLSDREKENMKSVYFRNEEDQRKGVEYVMSKILGFYKECLELVPRIPNRT